MIKWIVSLGLSLLALGSLLFTVSQTLETHSQSITPEVLLYEDRFEMKREEVRVYNFTFPQNVTVVTIVGSNMCVGLRIYNETFQEFIEEMGGLSMVNYTGIAELLGNLPKPISWSHSEYYRHLIPNNRTMTYYFILYNYPACYPKSVHLEIGYTTGKIEMPEEEPITFRNQLLSTGLASIALGLLLALYGFIKEPKI